MVNLQINLPLLFVKTELEMIVEDITSVKFVPSRAQCLILTLTKNGTDGLALIAGTDCPAGSTPAYMTSTFSSTELDSFSFVVPSIAILMVEL